MSEYKKWLVSPRVDADTRAQLERMSEAEADSAFSARLEFGTAGLRGVMGAGVARMNVYTVRHATKALAECIKRRGGQAAGVVIAYDCRHNSPEFALESALVLSASGIKCYLFDELRPTPELSFAVRSLGCAAGINITASHNPAEYNGYKVYGPDGAQLSPESAAEISALMDEIDIFEGVGVMPRQDAAACGLLVPAPPELDELYLSSVKAQCVSPELLKKWGGSIRVLFTPFHGAGYRLIPRLLGELGVTGLSVLEAQAVPDGGFTTVVSPNPEDKHAFDLALEYARKNEVDIIIGSDPDADRLGLVINCGDGQYRQLTGNQTGVLLLDYIISSMKERGALPPRPVAIKSIVSTDLARELCRRHGVECEDVLTGFKFIGERMSRYEHSGEKDFIFGFEESSGYLKGGYARDKDAVEAAMLCCEMLCRVKERGGSLASALEDIYRRCGYYEERVLSITVGGADGAARMARFMEELRGAVPERIGALAVRSVLDYSAGDTGLPKADVLRLETEAGAVTVRPSGTEPKLKIYLSARGESHSRCAESLELLEEAARSLSAGL